MHSGVVCHTGWIVERQGWPTVYWENEELPEPAVAGRAGDGNGDDFNRKASA